MLISSGLNSLLVLFHPCFLLRKENGWLVWSMEAVPCYAMLCCAGQTKGKEGMEKGKKMDVSQEKEEKEGPTQLLLVCLKSLSPNMEHIFLQCTVLYTHAVRCV